MSPDASQINRIIALVEKERAKGDITEGERNILDAAGEIAGRQAHEQHRDRYH
ncbi:hypothetical protein AFERRI_150047 [Acidithiobacillus ferrivorans]|uniref:Uncharacterized protein n=1 Tax=Acidithiobacillus ferrivorans TaxID=160808 RepID=A0A060UK64_9PROT|nr:hypothetical protein AFERRI_150047 [Acidithiobacillus ferrivorans]